MRTTPALLRDLLGAAILHIRSGRAVSRSALASTLGIAPSTVGLYVDQLIADGFVDESGVVQGAVGRPQRTLAPVPQAGWFAGVEFNAERLQAVRVDFAGRQISAQVKTFSEGTDARTVLQAVKNAVAALAKTGSGPLLAIGIGAPGIVDPAAGVSSHYAFIPEWNEVPIAATVRERFEVPVTLDNNLRAIAIAERWFGGGRDLADYVILGPRSGFAIAIVQGGQLMRGAHHAAGEIGLWPWPSETNPRRELQEVLSAPAVWRRLAGVSSRSRLPQDLRAALAGFTDATGPAREAVDRGLRARDRDARTVGRYRGFRPARTTHRPRRTLLPRGGKSRTCHHAGAHGHTVENRPLCPRRRCRCSRRREPGDGSMATSERRIAVTA